MEDKEIKKVMPFIEGEIIDLGPINLEHVNLYTKWGNDPDVRRYARNTFPWNLEEVKKWFEQQKESGKRDVTFEIWHKKDKKPIGTARFDSINWLDRNANIFTSIGEPEYWGQGIGPEAAKLLVDYGFEELNFHKIHACINAPNKRSLRTAEKVGLKFEATLKEQVYIEGEYVDEVKLAIFKKDWLNSKKNLIK